MAGSWLRNAFTTEAGQARRAERRDARTPPKAPTAGQLYSGPQAQWGAYDPNTGAYTPTAVGSNATRQFGQDARSGARQNYERGLQSGSGWAALQQQRASDADAARTATSRGFNSQMQDRYSRLYNDGNSLSGLSNEEVLRAIGERRGQEFTAGRDLWNQNVADAAARHAAGPAGPGSRTGATPAGRPTGATAYGTGAQGQSTWATANNAAIRQPGSGATHPVAMAGVRGDEAGRTAAQQALQQLQQVSREGWTPIDRLALDAAQRQASLGERSQREALLASSRARGIGGSALGFSAALGAQQGAANRSADYATQLGLAGRERALGATQASANLGMGLDDQAFAQASQRAAAVDAANQWFTGRQDDAAARAYEAQLAAAQAAQQRAQQRAGMIMGGIGSAFNMGTGLAGLLKDEEGGEG